MNSKVNKAKKVRKVKSKDNIGALLRLTVISALVALSLSLSCRNPEQPVVTHSDAILGYMELDLDARELFTSNLFPGETLLIDSGGDSSKSIVLTSSIRSNLSVFLFQEQINTAFGDVFAATVSFSDLISGDYIEKRIQSDPGYEIEWKNLLERKALFYRLDNDAAEYLGWNLVGYRMGRPLHQIQPQIKITRNPGSIRSEILTNKTKEFDLPFNLVDFTYLKHVDILKPSDSIEIETRGLFSISANTNSGFRTLASAKISSTHFRYGFKIPQSDPAQRFFFLITFQEAPFLFVDSLKTVDSILSIDTIPIIPPDTNIDSICEIFIDPTCESWGAPDTTIDSLIYDTILDTFIIPRVPRDTVFEAGESWTFPYSVRL